MIITVNSNPSIERNFAQTFSGTYSIITDDAEYLADGVDAVERFKKDLIKKNKRFIIREL